MPRKPRRQFLAPFVLTAAVALPGCKPKAQNTTVENPPGGTYQSWTLWASADGCELANDADNECPPETECNPPPPMPVACPEGFTEGSVQITQASEGGPCTMDGAEVACPEPLPFEEEEDLPEDLPEEELPEE